MAFNLYHFDSIILLNKVILPETEIISVKNFTEEIANTK